jgi:hypothetical protein
MKTAPLVATLLVGANATLTPDQMGLVTEGFMGAALHYEKLDGYKACAVDDNVATAAFVEEAMTDLETKSIAGIGKAVSQLQAAFKQISSNEALCKADSADAAHLAAVEAYMAKYPDMASLEAHVKSDLLWNGISIARELDAAHSSWNAGDYLAYGQSMGVLVDEVIIGTDKIKAEGLGAKAVAVDAKEVEQIVVGILLGAINAEGLENIQNCIKDGETIFGDVETGIQLLQKGDAADELKGLEAIGAGIFEIKAAIADCKGVVADFDKLAKMAAVFTNPWSFAYHVGRDLVVNGVAIFGEVEDSVSQYKAANYGAFGEDIGEALAKLLLGGAVESQARWELEQQNAAKSLF